MSGCTCERYQIPAPDGTVLEGELVRDPMCREHGFPTDQWPAGHPLRRHMLLVEKATGDVIGRSEARARFDKRERRWWLFDHMFREETPRETESRLYAESLATPDVAMSKTKRQGAEG